jgi:hypothetical protein
MASSVRTVLSAQELLRKIRAHLSKSSSVVMRGISCDYDRGLIFLRGRVPCAYCGQLAQQSVASVVREIQVCNEIAVITS